VDHPIASDRGDEDDFSKLPVWGLRIGGGRRLIPTGRLAFGCQRKSKKVLKNEKERGKTLTFSVGVRRRPNHGRTHLLWRMGRALGEIGNVSRVPEIGGEEARKRLALSFHLDGERWGSVRHEH